MILTDYIYEERAEEEHLPALNTGLTHRYNDSKNTKKNAGTD